MRRLRTAMLTACVAAIPLIIATGAKAANSPEQGVVLYNAAGVPVAILTPIQQAGRPNVADAADPSEELFRQIEAASADDAHLLPFARLMAQQDQMMHQVIEQMRGMMGGADPFAPGGMIDAAVPAGAIGAVPGAEQIVVSTFSSGHGSCGRTITFNYAGGSDRPVVSVRDVGDACGAIEGPGTRLVPAARESAPEQAAPALPSPSAAARTYRIDYRTPVRPPVARDQRG